MGPITFKLPQIGTWGLTGSCLCFGCRCPFTTWHMVLLKPAVLTRRLKGSLTLNRCPLTSDINCRNYNPWSWSKLDLLWTFCSLFLSTSPIFFIYLTKAGITVEEGPSIEKDFYQTDLLACLWWIFLNWWLMCETLAYRGLCHPWTAGPGYNRKTGWASHEENSTKQHSSMAFA